MKMGLATRRDFLCAGAALTAAGLGVGAAAGQALATAEQRAQQDKTVEVLNPLSRVPLSFLIDDSTCLVNLAHFCVPQFADVWPQDGSFKGPWKTWPREIPDAFLRKFGQWCGEHGVKGKFSIIPNPACVGWLDRGLPGWSRRELLDSLKLVRELMTPRWDITPEMITHTRVIDLKTGRPFAEISPATTENTYPQTHKSADELAAYLAYALRILKNCDLPCEGITTPGAFGELDKSALSLAVRESVRDVFAAELPFYFKYVLDAGKESTQPKVEHVDGLDTDNLRAVVSVPAGTGDWFGNWDGCQAPKGQLYCNRDATSGRMVELIERGEPAVMLCHWAGLYSQGTMAGFEAFKQVILALEGRFREQTLWMKISEIARYWAAKKLTRIERSGGRVLLSAPLAAPRFTLRIAAASPAPPKLTCGGRQIPLSEVKKLPDLAPGAWLRQRQSLTVCFDLPKGQATLNVL